MQRISWSQLDLKTVSTVEDPLLATPVHTAAFVAMYHSFLETLDGLDMESCVGFFFERSPLNASMLLFVDEDARSEFAECVTEMQLVPPLQEIMEGESAEEKRRRKQKEKKPSLKEVRRDFEVCFTEDAVQAPPLADTVDAGAASKGQKRTKKPINKLGRSEQVLVSLEKLRQRLQKETDVGTRKSLEDKIERTLEVAQQTR